MASTTLIVLFNLKPGVAPADYERFAKELDIPTVKSLQSVDDFRVFRASGLFGADGVSPFQYVEIIEVNYLNGLIEEVGRPEVGKVVAAFRDFAENPIFILSDEL
jgi:hypothetical protein